MIDLANYPCLETDDLNTTGVLTSDEIEHYVEKCRMIDPFDPINLKPSGYELSLGEEYSIGGTRKKLDPVPGKNELIIPPFEVAIISIKEMVNLPRFIIARWNLRVEKIYEGLLWTGAKQVDAGWVGPLFCPIYNLSNKDVVLRLGERIILMDFTKTTPFKKNTSKEYPRPPRRQKIDDYNCGLESALFTEAACRIKETEKKINRIESMTGIMFACIAIIVTALSIFVTSGRKISVNIPIWLYLSVGLSLAALAISLYTRVKVRLSFKSDKDRWFKFIVAIYIVISSTVIIFLGIKIWPLW